MSDKILASYEIFLLISHLNRFSMSTGRESRFAEFAPQGRGLT